MTTCQSNSSAAAACDCQRIHSNFSGHTLVRIRKTQLSNSANVTTDLQHQIREWDQNDRFMQIREVHTPDACAMNWGTYVIAKFYIRILDAKKTCLKMHSSLTAGRMLRSLRRVPCLWHAKVPYKNSCYIHAQRWDEAGCYICHKSLD